MKRTAFINKDIFRKKPKLIKITPIALALISVLTLSSCSESMEDLTIYTTAEDCINNNPSFKEACLSSYKAAETEAIDTAPKYATLEDCQAEFGVDGCQSVPQNSSEARSGGSFMPLLAGYMFGRLMGGNQYAHKPLYNPQQKGAGAAGAGKLYDNQGRQYGAATSGSRVSVPKGDLKPVKTATTMKRGGFGQMVAKQHAVMAQKQAKSSNNRSSSGNRAFGGVGG